MLIQKTVNSGEQHCRECGKDTEYLVFFGEPDQSGFIPVCGSCLIHTAVYMLQIGLGIPPNEYQIIDTSDPGMFTAPINIGIGSSGPIQYTPETKTSQPSWTSSDEIRLGLEAHKLLKREAFDFSSEVKPFLIKLDELGFGEMG